MGSFRRAHDRLDLGILCPREARSRIIELKEEPDERGLPILADLLIRDDRNESMRGRVGSSHVVVRGGDGRGLVGESGSADSNEAGGESV